MSILDEITNIRLEDLESFSLVTGIVLAKLATESQLKEVREDLDTNLPNREEDQETRHKVIKFLDDIIEMKTTPKQVWEEIEEEHEENK